MLERHEDIQVIAEAADGRTAIEVAEELRPDVVVMDVGMPGLNGIDATRRLSASQIGSKVVALSMHTDRRFTTEMLRAGAKGYVLKDGAFEELALAIRSVAKGNVYLSPRVAGVVVDDYVTKLEPERPAAFTSLTPREREVLQLIAEGRSTKQVAAALHVSIKTVETHRRQLMEKLQLYSVAELTKFAIREGISALES